MLHGLRSCQRLGYELLRFPLPICIRSRAPSPLGSGRDIGKHRGICAKRLVSDQRTAILSFTGPEVSDGVQGDVTMQFTLGQCRQMRLLFDPTRGTHWPGLRGTKESCAEKGGLMPFYFGCPCPAPKRELPALIRRRPFEVISAS
jgi:hypothetical protein